MATKIGLELELLIVDSETGKLKNYADAVLNSWPWFIKECAHGVVEVLTDPFSDLAVLKDNLYTRLDMVWKRAQSLDVVLSPITQLDGDFTLTRRESLRYRLNDIVLGENKRGIVRRLCATHLHIDKEDDVAAQYNLLVSADPAFAFMNSSPYFFGKDTGFNGSRVQAYRNQVFGDLPLHGVLTDYVLNKEELEQLGRDRLESWLNQARQGLESFKTDFFAQYCDFISDMESDYISELEKRSIEEQESIHNIEQEQGLVEAMLNLSYDEKSVYWGPVREREKTIEVRNMDANSPDLVLAMAAFYKGLNDFVFRENREVILGSNYSCDSRSITLPKIETIRDLETRAYTYGPADERVHAYLTYLVDIAENGLPSDEKKYLAPLKIMLDSRQNRSDEIRESLPTNPSYDDFCQVYLQKGEEMLEQIVTYHANH